MDCSRQVSLSMEFSRQEYWSELPFPSPEDLPNPETKSASLASPALAGGFFTSAPPGKPISDQGQSLFICQEETLQNAALVRDDVFSRKKTPLQWTQTKGGLTVRI